MPYLAPFLKKCLLICQTAVLFFSYFPAKSFNFRQAPTQIKNLPKTSPFSQAKVIPFAQLSP